MAYPSFTAGEIMDRAAVLNNDPAKEIYTYAKQIPLLNSALQDLQEIYELNEIPVTATEGTVLSIPSSTSVISFTSTPPLPADLVEPELLWERPHNVDPYTPMTRVNFLPEGLSGVQLNQFIWYVWESQQIRLLSANQINDIKMNYTRYLFSTVAASTDAISIINAQGYLEYHLGALIASLFGENITRAQELEGRASTSLDRIVGIGTKTRQAIMTRRRPFRQGYKRGSYQ